MTNDQLTKVLMTEKNHSVNVVFASDEYKQIGLTKREFFAASALPGIISFNKDIHTPVAFARAAVLCADALIEALNEDPSTEPLITND